MKSQRHLSRLLTAKSKRHAEKGKIKGMDGTKDTLNLGQPVGVVLREMESDDLRREGIMGLARLR